MSPASNGLELERYIGACLFSQNGVKSVDNKNNIKNNNNNNCNNTNNNNNNNVSQNKQFFHVYHQQVPRNHQHHHHDVWAGGIPLISFANRQKSRKIQENQRRHVVVEDPSSSLARLAVHTQGAPLIVTKSFHHRKNKQNRNPNAQQQQQQHHHHHRHTKVFENSNIKKIQNNKCGGAGVNTDSVSVTSDESSSSNNSEFCLPRIIKPRKRRKKDRKPLLERLSSQDGFSTDSASPEVDAAALGLLFPFTFDFSAAASTDGEAFDDAIEEPQLHHAFEDVEDVKDMTGGERHEQATSVCQCRYCDPNSQIWDMDKNCFSPFLTHPSGHLLDVNHLSSVSSNSSSSAADCLELGFSLMSLSDEEGTKQKMMMMPSSMRRRSDFLSSRDLEVSTEIVTSVNGHRDLEIKFFSTNSENGRKVY